MTEVFAARGEARPFLQILGNKRVSRGLLNIHQGGTELASFALQRSTAAPTSEEPSG